jgi:hypothetical protein
MRHPADLCRLGMCRAVIDGTARASSRRACAASFLRRAAACRSHRVDVLPERVVMANLHRPPCWIRQPPPKGIPQKESQLRGPGTRVGTRQT